MGDSLRLEIPRLTEDPAPEVRRRAMLKLVSLEHDELIVRTNLLRRLNDSDPAVREVAARLLKSLDK